MLLCPIRNTQAELNSFATLVRICVCTTNSKKLMSQNTTSFWIRSVIDHVYVDCRVVKVNVHKVWKDWYFSPFQKELCSPTVTEIRFVVLPDDLFAFYLRCHPQVYGHLFHWPCGGYSRGCVAFGHRVSNSCMVVFCGSLYSNSPGPV